MMSHVVSDVFLVEELQKKSPWKTEVRFFETLTSTNTIALEMAEKGAPEGTIVLADQQTHGRGQFHRPWSSPKGMGIFLSLILRLPINDVTIPSLSQLGPVALCDALDFLKLELPALKIKEPNDLLLDQKKVAGVLVETRSGTSSYAVVGIGLNVHQQEKDFPSEIVYPVTSLALSSSSRIARQEIALALTQALYDRYQQLLYEPRALEATWKGRLGKFVRA
jgi:BirA family biotin operon repressor/biotin-[acetyl-CoA-carboxylase] ligase